MVQLLEHRGPDDVGLVTGDGYGLAMRRLAVIDIESGQQPMVTQDGSIALVFNGEIYNYREQRDILIAKGFQFRTSSDTEVILRAYQCYGKDFCSRLRGMFAVAIWDSRTQELILSRDRIGEKPLYYFENPGSIVFGSEIKSVLPAVPHRGVESSSVVDFISLGYVPGERTFFEGIKKLNPGEQAIWSQGVLKTTRYWRPEYDNIVDLGFDNSLAELDRILDDAVELNLRSDVEVGSFLSGGLDSSLLTAKMVQKIPTVKTFSVGYEGVGGGFNELNFARQVSKHLGTEHHELLIEPKSNIELLPKIIWHFDEPHGEPTSILVHLLCEFVAKHVKVAVGGTGGDELFFGYPKHKGLRYLSYYNRVPRPLRAVFEFGARGFLREGTKGNRLNKRVRRFLAGATVDQSRACSSWYEQCDAVSLRTLLADKYSGQVPDVNPFLSDRLLSKTDNDELLRGLSAIDIDGYLPEYQLAYMDRMSMANSLEVRSPLCDYRLTEFATSLPTHYRLKGLTSKHILKEHALSYLPKNIVYRKKVGFDSPIGAWLKQDLRDFTIRFLSRANISQSGLLNPDGVASILDAHLSGKRDYSLLIWSIVALETWYRLYIELNISSFDSFDSRELRGFQP